jgi:hypothetical protein
MSDNEISKWLDSKFYIKTYPLSFNLKNNELNYYYKENDKNIKINNNEAIKIMIDLNLPQQKYIQTYLKNNEEFLHYLDHNTPRYQANMIFNKMIDYCIENKYFDNQNNPLINKFLRNAFYEYCYENTTY